MNENLNLIELLKDCPIGTKLYSSAHGEVELEEVHLNSRTDYPIEVRLSNNVLEGFTQDGRLFEKYNGECMLFPSREQRDWGKFKLKCLKAADAEPNLASLWHDASEEPIFHSDIVVIDKHNGWWDIQSYDDKDYDYKELYGWEACVENYEIVRWAYIDDLLPKSFGNSEQLKGGEK